MTHRAKQIRRIALVPAEWLGIAFGICIIPWLPRKGLFALADALSRIMYAFDKRGRNRALENLRIISGKTRGKEGTKEFNPDRAKYEPTAAEERIIRRSYRNMARTVGYAFWTCCRAKKRCRATGEADGATKSFLSANKPAITVSGHIGCWEILSQLAFLEGHRMMSVAKAIGTGGMTALLIRARKSIGQDIVRADGALKALLQGMRDGKSLGLLVDQSLAPRKGGIWIRFLGRPLSVSAAPAFFAAKCKSPIIVAWSRPLKDGRYRCEDIDEIPIGESRDIWLTTQRIANDLERVVRRHPSAWVLNYNLFRHNPTNQEVEALKARERKAERKE